MIEGDRSGAGEGRGGALFGSSCQGGHSEEDSQQARAPEVGLVEWQVVSKERVVGGEVRHGRLVLAGPYRVP